MRWEHRCRFQKLILFWGIFNGQKEDLEEIYSLDSGGFTQFLTGVKEQTPSIQLKCTIKELVDKDRLRDAVEKTLNIFSTFKMTLALGGSNQIPVYKVNSKDVDVYFYDGEPHNYGKESNGYLFRVYYFDKSILLSFNHILTDAFGVSEFLKCILFFYFNIFDNNDQEIRKRLKVDPDDFRDLYALYGNPDCESFSIKDKWQNEVVVPNGMKYRKGESVKGHRIVFSIQDFIKISKKAESSVFPFMSWLVSNAIARTYGDENKLVTGAGAYNCRKMFNSNTSRSFSQSYVTVFHPKERSMNLEQQLTIQRGRMDIETEEGTISKSIAERKNFMDRMIGNARGYIFDQQSRDQSSDSIYCLRTNGKSLS
ncbi:MAG: hypothetical protein IJR96_10810 [Pseudobutyrivibrio sp.]|nr:hypothetical protein [Pseudobutyrivibrio sp.]